ncbi:MAG: YbhB/YbcL family Raf kinase inhibitor-like protein [Bacteroidota bacterium]
MHEIIIMGISCVLALLNAPEKSQLTLTSSAFSDGTSIPTKYANIGVSGGKNISPPLKWYGVPAGTKSFAISIIDVHPIASNWIHWMVIDLPKTVTALPEGASGKNIPEGSKELDNSFGKLGYGGPQPPPGSGSHPYLITLYALNVEKLGLKQSTPFKEFRKALVGKILGEVRLIGMYER